jgi:glycosyltransferase involved in cell wall biosynthesis
MISLVSEHASPLATLGSVDAGGQNVHVAALAGALADLGHQVVVHTRRDRSDLPRFVPLRDGVTVHHVDAGPAEPIPKDELLPYMAEFGDELAVCWEGLRPDVVHSHFWMSGLAALRGARDLDLPVAHTYHALGTVKRRHQGSADTSSPQRVSLETSIGREAARLIATCRDEVRELAAMGLDGERTRIVPCGVDTQQFTPGPAPRRRRPRLLIVGRLVPRKGTETALAALARLPEAELVVVGGPPAELLAADDEAGRLASIAGELGVSDRFRMLGAVSRDKMPAVLRSADIVLCPARYEPFGIVPLEAMACGVPVIASAVGGHLDTVVDRRTGRLVPVGDPDALAEAVTEVLGSPGGGAAMGQAGRRRVLANFGWDRVAERTELVYQELAGGGQSSAMAAGAEEVRS